MAKPPSVLRLGYEGCIASFRAPADDLAWLLEFLAPCFELDPAPAEDPGATLEIERVDDAETVRAFANGASPAFEVAAFANEQGSQLLPGRYDADGALCLRDEQLGVVYRVRQPERSARATRVEIVSEPGSPRARVALMRVARELVMNDAAARGEPVLHAAVVAGRDGGKLIAGAKRAGKTTCLVQALRAGADYVSNDRAVLVAAAGEPVARGIPTIVRIRNATLETLPAALRVPLEAGRLDHLSSLEELCRGNAPPRPRPGRPRNLSPAQLCDWLGVRARRQVPVTGVVLLRTAAEPGVALRALAPGEAQPRLRECAFDAQPGSALVPSRARARTPASGDAGRDLTRDLPCHELALGIGTPPDEIAEALSALVR